MIEEIEGEMNRKKKFIIFILLSLFIAFAITACRKNKHRLCNDYFNGSDI